MIALGIWQLGRADEKAELIAQYQAALSNGQSRPFPAPGGGVYDEADLFHPAALNCRSIIAREAVAGRSADGASGIAHIARCETDEGPADVKIGWSRSPDAPTWAGGPVRGLIVPGGIDGARLQMIEPAPGLSALARPDPRDLPNNHLAYAGQWFFFALTALVIYALSLRRRTRERR